ncbi:MAG: extracellular solute-binding protein [Chloroflexi bacterium]|nr:extracellular solute-binding protein [Chloroflexota bacterium]
MKRLVVMAFALVFGALACAPAASPAPQPSPPTKAPPTTQPAPVPAAVAGDPALQNLVEAAKKEGSVTLYSFNFVGDVGTAMQRGFEERYGVKVDIITGRGAEFIERLKTEARVGNRTGDFSEGSQVHIFNMKNAGVSTSLKDLPVLREKDVWKVEPTFLDPDGQVLAAYPTFMQSLVNTRLVKPEEEPKSWNDLLQPKWKGKILFTDPVVSSNAYIIFQPLVRTGILNEDYLQKLGAQDLQFVTGPAEGVQKLSRGESPLFVSSQAIDASNAVREGAPIKIFDLKEGTAGQAIMMTVIKDGPHPNAARLFANWWLSQEGQSVYTKAKGAPTIRKDVKGGLPAGLDLDPAKPVLPTADDLALQGKMFSDKAWVPLLKKAK